MSDQAEEKADFGLESSNKNPKLPGVPQPRKREVIPKKSDVVLYLKLQ
jgi:hypothetical protein